MLFIDRSSSSSKRRLACNDEKFMSRLNSLSSLPAASKSEFQLADIHTLLEHLPEIESRL